jgi:hypothetical protein
MHWMIWWFVGVASMFVLALVTGAALKLLAGNRGATRTRLRPGRLGGRATSR